MAVIAVDVNVDRLSSLDDILYISAQFNCLYGSLMEPATVLPSALLKV